MKVEIGSAFIHHIHFLNYANKINIMFEIQESSRRYATRSCINLVENYLKILSNDPLNREAECCAWRDVMNNDHAERGVGILTDDFLIEQVNEEHRIYEKTIKRRLIIKGLSLIGHGY